MKHPGKQDNEIRVFTASLCICRLINQFYTKYFRYFVVKLIPWAAIAPQISLVPQSVSCLAWSPLDRMSLHTFPFVHDGARSQPRFLVSRAMLPSISIPHTRQHSDLVEPTQSDRKRTKPSTGRVEH